MNLRTLESTAPHVLHEAFLLAFADYSVPLSLGAAQLQELHRRRGARFEFSVGAFEGDNLVGFTVNGFGSWRGALAGYDSGTGVVPSARGQGLASRMMEKSLELLREQGAKRYVLEVLQTNATAFRVYESAGFRVSRELVCWTLDEVRRPGSSDVAVDVAPALDALGLPDMHDWAPSWQNSTESIARAGETKTILTARREGRLAGYAVLFDSGDLAQFAVDRRDRRNDVGTALVRAARTMSPRPLRIINTDAGDVATTRFLTSVGATESARQFEMEDRALNRRVVFAADERLAAVVTPFAAAST